MMIPPIKTKKELADRKRRLTALVMEAKKNAKERGFVLARGCWNRTTRKTGDIRGTVCAVGAIGLLKRPGLVGRRTFRPETVAPLVRNGCGDLADDAVLYALSDGFEGEESFFQYGDYLPYGDYIGLLAEYLEHAFKLGKGSPGALWAYWRR